ncbi:transcriptional regulator TbsP [Halobaculum sp. MBLA0147]|uniref:transcriptional regulator TbsP n=1 Tax=Halobaculum sp. MBLA0147 TaxID=3079934 RepID=UPI003524350C
MSSNLLEPDTEELFADALADAAGDVYLIDPSERVLRAFVAYGNRTDDDYPPVRVVADRQLLKDLFDDFLVAADTADLVADGSLGLRELDGDVDNTLLVSEDELYAIVTATERVGALAADESSFLTDAHETYAELWERSDRYNLRTPPLSRVRETMAEQMCEAVREDFDAVLASLETARGNGAGLDEVTVALLAAANNEALLYDISKWGEDVGIASKATFSRTKTRLEDVGIVDTEKVPIDVGRPRLRLKFGDEEMAAADADELAELTMDALA